MDEARDSLESVKKASIEVLLEQLQHALEDAHIKIVNQTKGSQADGSIFEQKDAIKQRFAESVAKSFENLVDVQEEQGDPAFDYSSLTLVEEEDLEAMIALEGMVSHARNMGIRDYLSFTTRMDAMLFGVRVDESNNPLDPEQLGESFKDAIRPVALNSKALLIAYRCFNAEIFHQLEKTFAVANQILIDHGVLPDLDLAARQKQEQQVRRPQQRESDTPEVRAFKNSEEATATLAAQNQQMLSLMQGLMHHRGAGPATQAAAAVGQTAAPAGQPATAAQAGAAAAPTAALLGDAAQQGMPATGLHAGMLVGGRRVEMIEQDQLFAVLGDLQDKVESLMGKGAGMQEPQQLKEELSQALQASGDESSLTAIDSKSGDVIQLVTMLYEAIWNDKSIPIPVKDLLGRTQISVLKIALLDSAFFDEAEHPIRLLLNELATAGISWTDYEHLEGDSTYALLQSTVNSLVTAASDNREALQQILDQFRRQKGELRATLRATEARLQDSEERQKRLDEVSDYALARIRERILDPTLPESINEFLETHFRRFVVKVLLREGPGGVSWKPVMNTIDVLLWTVQPERGRHDLERFMKVNPRLMTNLGKALTIAGLSEEESAQALAGIKKVQDASMSSAGRTTAPASAEVENEEQAEIAVQAEVDLPADDPHLREVSKYPLGIWLEFLGEDDEQNVRCTLAARIESIDKFVFVNAQGVKVIEKSRMGLARELREGTVRVISEGPLLERAMESVIGRLKQEAASSRQTANETAQPVDGEPADSR